MYTFSKCYAYNGLQNCMLSIRKKIIHYSDMTRIINQHYTNESIKSTINRHAIKSILQAFMLLPHSLGWEDTCQEITVFREKYSVSAVHS